MSRDLSSTIQSALAAANVISVLMARLDFAGGLVAVHNGAGTLSWNGDDYLGVGNLGAVSAVEESAETTAQGISLTLSGVPPEMIAVALGDEYQGRDARLYVALLDSGHRLIDDATNPYLVFRGRMDTMEITDGDTAEIRLTVENRMADWDRPRIRRYTHEDQQLDYPGDLGLEFVSQMVEKEIVWGR